jgi:hypothetical protein
VAGTRCTRTRLRWPTGFAALVIVLAAAGSAPARAVPVDDDEALFAQCRAAMRELTEMHRNVENTSFGMACARPDGTTVDPKLWLPTGPSLPAPTRPITAGQAGCVTGPGRPVVDTALISVSATARPGEAIIYEYQPLDAGETTNSSGSEVLEFSPGDLAPGGSYRWRARVDDTAEQHRDSAALRSPDDDELGWSPWCEFSVSANAVDYRGLGDVSLEALNELGLRPDRSYAVSLTRRQQRLLRAGTNVGRTNARMTLTGPRWTDLLVQLSESAFVEDEVAAETGEDNPSPDGTAYRALVDAISVKLGGPHHPELG